MFKKQPNTLIRRDNTVQPAPVKPRHSPNFPAPNGPAGRLIVGPEIRLKSAAIEDCDTLYVEGRVEASMDSRVIQIEQSGTFVGAAKIDEAEIHGHFEGNLTARERLVIHKTGKVTGTIRYGRLTIEEGGEVAGDIAAAGKDLPITEPNLASVSDDTPADTIVAAD